MKIDLITLHAVQNYGSVLQAYATQELFKEHGAEVTVINFARDVVKYENLKKVWGKGNIIKEWVMIPTIWRWKRVFDGFCKKKLNLTPNSYTSEEDFKAYPLNADAYCTGSDQVWNSKWNDGIIPQLYLSFVPQECYKFAYSASFGNSRLDNSEVQETQAYIDQYKHILVREDSALDILKEQYHYDACDHVVDPTLAMPRDFWLKLATPRKIKQEYMLIYNLNRSKEFDRYAVALAKRAGLKLVRLCTRYDQFYRPGKSILVPEVAEFVSLIAYAKYVLTDSFHATAFSMNMGTMPICVYPQEFGGRIESFLKLTDSTQCRVKNYGDFEVLNKQVDFAKVDTILQRERVKICCHVDKIFDEIRRQKDMRV